MTYEHLLHDFIDGTLDYQGEIALFSELRANDNLRRELKLLMLMQKSAAHDVGAYMPAADSQEAIFRRLGFSAGPATPPATGYGWRNMFIGRYMDGLVGALVGTLVTLLVMFGTGHPAANDGGNEIASASHAIIPASPVHHDTLFLHDVTAQGNGNAMGNGAAAMVAGRNQAPTAPGLHRPEQRMMHGNGMGDGEMPRRTVSDRTGTSHEIGTQAPAGAMISYTAPRHVAISPAAGTISEAISTAEPMPAISLPRSEETADDLLPFSTEYHAVASRNFITPPAGLEVGSSGLLRDRELAGFYHLGNGGRIGIATGEETFYQRFNELLPTGDIVRHEQSPALLWGGVAFRQSIGTISALEPFVGGVIGATRLGPMGRISLGAAYGITTDISLTAGGEMSALAYRFGGSWYLSPKYGFTYGLSLRF
ncbi:MAG: hypothetical protein JWQ98_85 [Chlorobi bacterium]|nr:hypothetical protein [Chlorobiota bacterium]